MTYWLDSFWNRKMLFDAEGICLFLQCLLIAFVHSTHRTPSPFKALAVCLVVKPKSCGFCLSASLLLVCYWGSGNTAGTLLWAAVLTVSGWGELVAGLCVWGDQRDQQIFGVFPSKLSPGRWDTDGCAGGDPALGGWTPQPPIEEQNSILMFAVLFVTQNCSAGVATKV